ncbi:MAG TPA: enoyl-CoA hydratase-related protein [Candidatus Limnocylindrales bacterium]|nr:enoyl-CoA hydratase-related protein [Candidatus Limnocylindrales bacterium]
MSGLVALELGRVAHLVLDNPPLNLVTPALLDELDAALGALEAAEPGDVRAVVVSGRGERAFSAGSDVRGFEANRGPAGRAHFTREEAAFSRVARLPMPTIAAIEGNALGGGLELALACDIRVASERARLGLTEVRLAVTPGAGGTQRLPRVVGAARAKELILTGRVLTAAEAERIGLVAEVVPEGRAVERATEIGAEIAERGPLAVREAKRLVDAGLDRPIEDGIAAEIDASVRIFATDDLAEGARAFLEKRAPVYRGR